MSDGYCINCKKKVPVWIRHKTRTIKYALRIVTYDEVYAVCQKTCACAVREPGIDIYERSAYAV